jgi:transcriptional regulator with PAS, ATPase and Fis domain
MSEVMFLSTYAKLTESAHAILKDRKVRFEIIEVPPLRAEEIVKGLNKKTQVIISRGGTAMLARHYTSVPVIDIAVTFSDILDAVGKITNIKNKKKAIISTANIIYDPKFISKIRGLEIDFVAIADSVIPCHDWVEENIQSEVLAQGGGYDVIIGDALVCAIAAKHGISNILIESSEESLNLAVNEALRIIETNRLGSQMMIKRRKEILENGWVAHYSFHDILGHGRDLEQSVSQARLFARSNGSVLIEGETGTGKELFAQSIHNESDRVYGPFVSVNCSAISDSLLESELFGYDSGAFTGANKGGKKGLFECAQNGTIFLDEISETTMNSQAKLLRVLQEKKIRRVGSEKIIDLNARIICATNKNLLELADCGQFRRDLYYRLSELELYLPPLRERRDDVLIIADHILRKEAGKINGKMHWKDAGIFAPLLSYDWPGNIRELRNFIVKLATYSEDGELTSDDVAAVFRASFRGAAKKKSSELTISISSDLKLMEKEIFTKLLLIYDGDKERLCREYGISKPTLWRKLGYGKDL